MRKSLLSIISVTVLFVIILSGCSKSASSGGSSIDYAITGGKFLSVGSTLQLKDTLTGGTWATSDPTIASITSGGLVTGVKSGIVFISYSVSGNPSFPVYDTVSVTPAVNVVPITGGTSVTVNGTLLLADATAGGVWASSDTTLATVTQNGLVTGIAAGSPTITYIVNNAYANFTAAQVISVH